MADISVLADRLVFGLDIGTRSIVGSVGYLEKKKFNVLAHHVIEHDTRSMIDGQIHDIQKVGETISKVKRELEKQLELPLSEVCIAAAGRVLKTVTVHAEIDFEEATVITPEHIHSLDLVGIENAYDAIRNREGDEETDFFCVGYSVVKYYLNDYQISNLEGHKAKKISADILATFLPDEVVDSLYAAIDQAELQVANLTLEPIAAINVAIPEKFRMLNIALVDVGAGTSDICVTKDGSIVAYGMIPKAGDEITDVVVQKYLVEFAQAEKMKIESGYKDTIEYSDILGLPASIKAEEVIECFEPVIDNITSDVAEKIKELNGGKSVSAVFVVGGGGKAKGFTEHLAKHLDIAPERVALRGEEVLGDVVFANDDVVKDPLLVTPIGICLNYFEQKNNFIFVSVNGERIKLYNSNTLTVADAAIQIGFPNDCIFPKSGKELIYYVNGKKRMKRGSSGDPAKITINGEEANIYSPIGKNNKIVIEESTAGAPARLRIEQLPEFTENLTFQINGKDMEFPRFVNVNDELQPGSYQIQDGDAVDFINYYTVEQILQFLDINPSLNDVYVNDIIASSGDLVYEGFRLKIEVAKEEYHPEDYYEPKKKDEKKPEEAENADSKQEDDAVNADADTEQKADTSADAEANDADTKAEAEEKAEDKPAEANAEAEKPSTEEAPKATEASENVESAQKPEEKVENKKSDEIDPDQIGVYKEPKYEDPNKGKPVVAINVSVNGEGIVLSGKAVYTFVDIFDHISFDLSYKKGKTLVTKINDSDCEYTQELNDGDVITIEWKDDK